MRQRQPQPVGHSECDVNQSVTCDRWPPCWHWRHTLYTPVEKTITFYTPVENKHECTLPIRNWCSAYAPGRCFMCIHQMAALFWVKSWHHIKTIRPSFRIIQIETAAPEAFSWNDVTAAILKLRCHTRNPTPSIDAYLSEEHSHGVASQSDSRPQSLRLFWRASPQEEQLQQQDEWQHEISFWSRKQS